MSPDASTVDPRARNWVWWSFQVVMQSLFVLAFRFRSKGAEQLPEGGALLLINHQSFIDPLVAALSLQRPVSYLARHNLFSVPVLGWILRRTYVIPIRRDSAATESIRLAVERLKQGYYVGIFPEGTRSDDGQLQELKPGFLAIIRRAEVPVVPVGVAGAGAAFPRGAWWIRPSTIRVVYGEPFSVEELRELTRKGQEQVFLQEVRRRLEVAMAAAQSWVRESKFLPVSDAAASASPHNDSAPPAA